MAISKLFTKPVRGILRYLKNVLGKEVGSKYGEFMADAYPSYAKEIPGFPFLCAYVAHPYSAEFAADLKLFKYRSDRAVAYEFDE